MTELRRPATDPDWRTVLLPVLRVGLYTATLLGLQAILLFAWPAQDPWHIFGENQRLELAQVALLGLAAALTLTIAFRRPRARGLGIVFTGLLAAMLVREHNNDLKALDVPHLWSLLVLAVLGVTALCSWPRRREVWVALGDFLRSGAFPWCAAAVITLLFVQALDEKAIWRPILGTEFPYVVRRVGEEVGELLGYGFLLIGLAEWALGLRSGLTPQRDAAS